MSTRTRAAAAGLVLLALAGLLVLAWLGPGGAARLYRRQLKPIFAPPARVAFETRDPTELGLDASALERLREQLAERNTRGLLVVRDGELALEWYRPGTLPFDRFSTAALAKGVIATTLSLAASSDGIWQLDASASTHLPAWRDDPRRSAIRVRDLLAHAAGIENVSFPLAEAVRKGRSSAALPEWKLAYHADPAARFRMAVEVAPLRFPPGERYEYSGVGYYALANALEAALRAAGRDDLRSYLDERVLGPLAIPREALSISYGTSYRVGDRRLYALGSGGRITLRALARIGELYANLGRFRNAPVLDPTLVKRAISDAGLPPPRDAAGESMPSIGLGWWVNDPVFFESLPADAAFAAGASHRIVLVVPSWQLVAVRMGGSLGEAVWEDGYWQELERHFVEPLAAAVARR